MDSSIMESERARTGLLYGHLVRISPKKNRLPAILINFFLLASVTRGRQPHPPPECTVPAHNSGTYYVLANVLKM